MQALPLLHWTAPCKYDGSAAASGCIDKVAVASRHACRAVGLLPDAVSDQVATACCCCCAQAAVDPAVPAGIMDLQTISKKYRSP